MEVQAVAARDVHHFPVQPPAVDGALNRSHAAHAAVQHLRHVPLGQVVDQGRLADACTTTPAVRQWVPDSHAMLVTAVLLLRLEGGPE